MNKKLKKILATVSAVAMCATSVVSMGAGAIGILMSEKVTTYTTSFSIGSTKYHLWQKATDYFGDENLKIYITDSEEAVFKVMAYRHEVAPFVIDGYNLRSEEDVAVLESYLSDNDMEYSIEDLKPNSSDVWVRIHIKFPAGTTKDEMYDVWTKVKEDTGFTVDWFMLESAVQVTEAENTLPEPTLTGDANEDGDVNMADAVLIMQVLSNPDEYKLTPQGIANADIDGDGVTAMDALTIQLSIINQ